MISQEALNQAKQAYDIEAACILEMKEYFDEECGGDNGDAYADCRCKRLQSKN